MLFIPLENFVKALVETSLTFTTVIVAMSLTSMEHLLSRSDQVSGGQFFNDFSAALYNLAPHPGKIFSSCHIVHIDSFAVAYSTCVWPGIGSPDIQEPIKV
jgi:hypothetical protein